MNYKVPNIILSEVIRFNHLKSKKNINKRSKTQPIETITGAQYQIQWMRLRRALRMTKLFSFIIGVATTGKTYWETLNWVLICFDRWSLWAVLHIIWRYHKWCPFLDSVKDKAWSTVDNTLNKTSGIVLSELMNNFCK